MPAASRDQHGPRSQEVFISYSRKDKEFVRRLDEELKRRDREAWVDWEGIPPGDTWEKTIYGAIEATHTFIFVLTPDSIASEVCDREIAHAAANNKRLVPIVHRDVVADSVPKSLGELNWIFFRESDDFEEAANTLVRALDTDLNWVRAHTRLLTRAIEWNANGRNKSFVLRGEDLRSAERWLAEAGAQKERQPTALQTEYILASRKEETRRQRIWRWSLTVGVVMVSLFAIVAWLQRGKAVQNEAKASQTLAGADFLRATEMIGQQRITDGLAHLARAARFFPPSHTAGDRIFTLLTQRSYPLPANLPVKLAGRVTCVRFVPGDHCLLAVVKGKSAQVFDARSGEPISKALLHDYPVQMAELSADGKLLATACGASEGWRPSEIWPSRKTQSNVAATAGYGRVWDVMTSAPVTEPLAHNKAVLDICFSPDSSRVLTGSEDQTARVWDARSGKPLTEPMHHTAAVVSARFNAEATRILAIAGGVNIWDLNGNLIASYATGAIAAKYTPDGRLIVAVFEGSGGEDAHFADTQVIDAATGKEIGKRIGGAGSSATSLSFDGGSKRLLEAFAPRNSNKEDNGGLQEIDLTNLDADVSSSPGEENIPVRYAVFTPEERRILAGLPDHTVRLWDRSDPERKPQMVPASLPGEPVYLEFEPSGGQFLVLSSDYQSEGEATESTWVQFWRRTMPQRIEVTDVPKQTTLPPQAVVREGNDRSEGEVLADTSRDKKRVVKIGPSGTVKVYDSATGKPLGVPIKQAEQYGGFFGMQTARFSNDGRLIATGEGSDFRIAKGMARVWDASTGRPVTAPLIHDLAVTSVAFSSDNERLATIEVPIPKMNSSKARIWDIHTGQPLSDVMAHNTMTFFAEFNNERTRLIQVSEASEEDAAATREIVDIGLPAHGVVPTWLPRLAEAVAGKRLNEATGVIEDLPDQWNSIEVLRREFASLRGDDGFALFGKWFLADTLTRTISPYSKVTVRSYVDECIKTGDDSALNQAEDMVAGNKELRDRVIAGRSQK